MRQWSFKWGATSGIYSGIEDRDIFAIMERLQFHGEDPDIVEQVSESRPSRHAAIVQAVPMPTTSHSTMCPTQVET
ncbi:hypothetical protein LAZ67_4000501 [Cordylochernes scorpioides]|uniref:Uncharacterized protein n=1 Tax=Cordylochernes scorpioides TaxID=51811 RepID=A0ABY6KBK3_9ARAC|nr:hypothetical protein LAZ67_4000501 [Cordylochernes scorpioides]